MDRTGVPHGSTSRSLAVTIVMYHSVSDTPGPYSIQPGAFRHQVEAIAQTFRVVPLGSLLGEATESGSAKRRVALTFDDAFADFGDTAFPILEELGLPSTVFVPTGFIGGYNAWDRDTPDWIRRPVMDANALRSLYETGLVEIGSHTVDHARMSALAADEMQRQAASSKATLEDLLGHEIVTFSYPYGQLRDFSDASSRVLADAGYRLAVTTHWGSRNSLHDLLTLKRVYFQESDGAVAVRRKIEGWYDWIGVKESAAATVRKALKTSRHRSASTDA